MNYKDFERNFKSRTLQRAKDAAPTEANAKAVNLMQQQVPASGGQACVRLASLRASAGSAV